MTDLKLSGETTQRLRCPVCAAPLSRAEGSLACSGSTRHAFPIAGGVPILLNEARSLFSIAELARQADAPAPRSGGMKERLYRLLPKLAANIAGETNYRRMATLLLQAAPHPRVLVLGGRIAGQGMDSLLADPAFELVETDIALGPRTGLICDAHDIPFADETFDGVVIQAVLEHVLDPVRCVAELTRVLKPGGLVYAETPFMQQVHEGRYDFTRYTHLGHRRLFRQFEEVDSGTACGPGMALAWAYQYFLLSFARSPAARAFVTVFARLTAFWLKYFDRFLSARPGAYDAASAFYFLGRKSTQVLDDRALIQLYRGAL